jgi:hypothetical protein
MRTPTCTIVSAAHWLEHLIAGSARLEALVVPMATPISQALLEGATAGTLAEGIRIVSFFRAPHALDGNLVRTLSSGVHLHLRFPVFRGHHLERRRGIR